MKLALIMCGLHYYEDYLHQFGGQRLIDFRLFYKNIKINLMDYFYNKNYEIDTFISTNNSKIENTLSDYYNPKIISYDNDNNRIFKLQNILKIFIEYINKEETNYDLICITRFDIYFLDKFSDNNLNLEKLNIVSMLENKDLIDDNLYIFPAKYLDKFYDIIKHTKINDRRNLHSLINIFNFFFEINFIKNENVVVNDLTFFKLYFFKNIQFIINKFNFTENIWYKTENNHSELLIYDNNIKFRKNVNGKTIFSWIGYNINKKGLYKLSFELITNNNIINYNFIKLHKPIKFYNISNCFVNKINYINIILNVMEDDDLLCLIFDNYNNNIEINIKNFSLIKNI